MGSKLTFIALLFYSASLTAAPFNGYIVKFKNGSGPSSQRAVSSLTGLGRITPIPATGFGNFALLHLREGVSGGRSLKPVDNSEIEYIEPNYISSVSEDPAQSGRAGSYEPEDEMFGEQWALNNGDTGEDLNALKAWSVAAGSSEIKIAVIDTGVDYNHPDLKNRIDVNLAELYGKPDLDDDGNGFVDDIYGYNFADNNGDPMDLRGHGTHCAGVIGAEHNAIGVAGVMAKVKIVPIKFISDNGEGENINAVRAIDYAIKRGVKIMSNSWGNGGESQALKDAIFAAQAAGVVFVAAAGNGAGNNDISPVFPASYDLSNVISVGAFSPSGAMDSSSNYGPRSVHVFAPGSEILSTYQGRYGFLSGTSMAAPHAAGVAGLMLAKDPGLTPAQIKAKLIASSKKTRFLSAASVSGGHIDAYEALISVIR
ncbi:MAG: S8 family peptidase [Elusimicrobiales bacterium]|jgi:subtilisin family serine protease